MAYVNYNINDGGGGHAFDSIYKVADYGDRILNSLDNCSKEEARSIYDKYKNVSPIDKNAFQSKFEAVTGSNIENELRGLLYNVKMKLSATNSKPFYSGNEPQGYLREINDIITTMEAQLREFKKYKDSYYSEVDKYNRKLSSIKDKARRKSTETSSTSSGGAIVGGSGRRTQEEK